MVAVLLRMLRVLIVVRLPARYAFPDLGAFGVPQDLVQ